MVYFFLNLKINSAYSKTKALIEFSAIIHITRIKYILQNNLAVNLRHSKPDADILIDKAQLLQKSLNIFEFLCRQGMITGKSFIEMALSFLGTEQTPHFDRIGFKVIGKKMFATYLSANNTATIFLTPQEQAVFCKIDSKNIYPVQNKWGEKGATTFNLNQLTNECVMEALLSAYKSVRSPK
jgi:hypothetical protein